MTMQGRDQSRLAGLGFAGLAREVKMMPRNKKNPFVQVTSRFDYHYVCIVFP